MGNWLVKAVLGGHEKAGQYRVRGSNEPLRKSKLKESEIKSLQLLLKEKEAEDHFKILFLLFCRKSDEHFFQQSTNTAAEKQFLKPSDMPHGLVPRDRAVCTLVRLIGTFFDGLLSLNLGFIHYKVGIGLPLKLLPLAGPPSQFIVFTFLMFVWIPRQIGLPAGKWAFLPYAVPLGVSFAPLAGPLVGDYFRPAFMACRSVILMLKLRSMMFQDVCEGGVWRSQELTDYFGTQIRYSQSVRALVMGKNNKHLGGKGLLSGCC